MAIRKGKNQEKLVKDLKKSDSELYPAQMSSIEVLRNYRINNSRLPIFKSWNKFKATVGRKFGNTGAVGAYGTNTEYSSAMKASDDAINAKRKEILSAKQNNLDSNKIDILNGELQNLQNVNNTLWLKSLGTGDRYTVGTLKDELAISAMQATGEHYHKEMGLSQEMGGFLPVLAYATGSYKLVTKPVSFFAGGIGNYFNLRPIAEDFGRLLEDVASMPFDIGTAGINAVLGKNYNAKTFKGMFIDRRFDDIEKLHSSEFGKSTPLTTREKNSFKKLSILMKDMSVEQRELAFKSIQEYREIRGRLVNAFPEGAARDEASEVFQLSFAHASGLAPLQALDRMAAAKIDPSDPNLLDLTQRQIEAENTLSIAQKGIDRLLTMMNNPEGGFDITRNKGALDLINNFKKAVDGQQLIIMERRQGLLDLTRDYVTKTLRDPLAQIDETTVSKIHNTNLLLNKNLMDDPIAARQSLVQTITEVRDSLAARAKDIETFRGTDKYKFKMGKLVEDMYDVQMEANYELGKSFYTKAEKIMEGQPPVDVSPIVEKMIKSFQGLEDTDLSYFFSSKSRFFNSRAGRLAKRAFDRMGARSLKNSGITDDHLEELKFFFKQPGDNYLGENPSLIEMALHMNKNGIKMADGSLQKTNINPFQASPFELDEMRSFFKNVAEKSASSQPDLTREYDGFIKQIDDAIGLNPALAKAMTEARTEYKNVIFDPARKGSVGYKINSSREGPERSYSNPNQYRYTYNEDFKPENFHEDISTAIFNLLENKGTNTGRKLQEKIDDLVYFWGDKGEAGQVAFDLTTDNGKAKLQNIQDLLKMQFHEHWGMLRENLVTQITKKAGDTGYDLMTSPITSPKGFDNVKKLQKLADSGAFKVQVKVALEDGTIALRERNLLELDEMIAADNDITHVLELSKKSRVQYEDLARSINDSASDVNIQARTALDIQEKSVKTFEGLISAGDDPAKFFETVIAKGNKESVEILKERYLTLRKTQLKYEGLDDSNLKEAVDKLEDEFNSGMKHYIVNGLLERAGTQRSSTIKLKGLDGKTDRNHVELANAAQFATDINNEDTLEVLGMFLDQDHIQFMQDMSSFMEFASGASQLRYSPSGVVRAISPNELISRAFNLARGMVSPTYVAAELGIRIAAQQGIELVGLALENKQAADIMSRMLDAPETLNINDIKNFGTLVKSYVARMIIKNGGGAVQGNYVSQSEVENYQMQTSSEMLEQLPEKGNFINKALNQFNAF